MVAATESGGRRAMGCSDMSWAQLHHGIRAELRLFVERPPPGVLDRRIRYSAGRAGLYWGLRGCGESTGYVLNHSRGENLFLRRPGTC
jgi:hypothetical protein